MNTYLAFYRSWRIKVEAETSLQAQTKAVAIFKARRSYDVTVVLVERDGAPITYTSE